MQIAQVGPVKKKRNAGRIGPGQRSSAMNASAGLSAQSAIVTPGQFAKGQPPFVLRTPFHQECGRARSVAFPQPPATA
jgi:hypothetical protein